MLDAVSATSGRNEVTLALYSGLRIGEVLGLRWSDVALDDELLTVSHALQRLGTDTKLSPVGRQSPHFCSSRARRSKHCETSDSAPVERQLAAGAGGDRLSTV